jgi:hypothetical protein
MTTAGKNTIIVALWNQQDSSNASLFPRPVRMNLAPGVFGGLPCLFKTLRNGAIIRLGNWKEL